jgi:hypothetical protein
MITRLFSFRYLINVSFDIIVAVLALLAFRLGYMCLSFPHELLFLSLLLVISRLVFLVPYILILMFPQYEYYARFALSLAQSVCGLAIAVVVIYIMYRAKKGELEVKTSITYTHSEQCVDPSACIHVNNMPKFSHIIHKNQKCVFQIEISKKANNSNIMASLNCGDKVTPKVTPEVIWRHDDQYYFYVEITAKQEHGCADVNVQFGSHNLVNLAKGVRLNDLEGVFPKIEISFKKNNDKIFVTALVNRLKFGNAEYSISERTILQRKICEPLIGFRPEKSWSQFTRPNRRIMKFGSNRSTLMKWKRY